MDERWISRFFHRATIPIIALFFLGAGFGAYKATKIKLDFGFHSFFEKSADLPSLTRYKDIYGEDINLIIVTVQAKEIFTPGVLGAIERLTEFSKNQPEVQQVTSLTNVNVLRSGEEEVLVEPFLKSVPSQPEKCAELRKEALSNSFLRRFLISDDSTCSAVILELKGHLKRQNRLISVIENFISSEINKNRGEKIEYFLGGVNVIQREYERTATQDMILNGILILLIMGVFLAFFYRNLFCVILPILSSLVSLSLILGFMSITGEPVTLVSQLVPELVLILSIADGVYVLSRYIEEREKHPPQKALELTMRAMIVACFFTSATTAAGFGSCVTASMYLIRRFGIYIAIAVGISFLSVILLIPSFLSFWKTERVPSTANSTTMPESPPLWGIERIVRKVLQFVVNAVLKHPRVIIISSILLTLISIYFSLRIEVQHRLLSEISEDNPVFKANKIFEEKLFGILSFGIEFEGKPDSMIEPEVLRKIDDVVKEIEKDKNVRTTNSIPKLLKEFNMKWMGEGEKYYKIPESRKLASQYMEFFDPEMKRKLITDDYSKTRISITTKNCPSSWWFKTMERLRPVLEKKFPPQSGISWRFNGSSHLTAIVLHKLLRDMLLTMLTSLIAVTVLMALLFKSLRIGLISMIPNICPIIVTAGFMGAVGIELRPATSIIFAVSLGIAVNDTIHLMARFREEILSGQSIDRAIEETLLNAGKPVIGTSFLLMFGYLVLLRSEFIAVRDFAILFSVTIFSALIFDLFLTGVLLRYTVKKGAKI